MRRYIPGSVTISKLLGTEYLKGLPHGECVDANRCTGASTAEAFRIIHEAMSNPGHPIPLVDRSMPYLRMDTRTYRQYFYRIVEDRIEKNGLKHLTLKTIGPGSSKFTLTYNIMQTYVKEQEVKEVWKEV